VSKKIVTTLVNRKRREAIATAVIAGFAAADADDFADEGCDVLPEEVARTAVEWADALIAELDKRANLDDADRRAREMLEGA
jgi:hypothetical protein